MPHDVFLNLKYIKTSKPAEERKENNYIMWMKLGIFWFGIEPPENNHKENNVL